MIEPLLRPAGLARGRRRDHCQVLEGIVSTFRTGLPWRDLPERFGPWQTAHGRFAYHDVVGCKVRRSPALLTPARSGHSPREGPWAHSAPAYPCSQTRELTFLRSISASPAVRARPARWDALHRGV
ncbi:transposase [Streptomyces longwoodensis]|uniref:transposase n=1 Tax=Streptomyces longwoodensis TaxID=68231 RepID=UPI00386B3B4F